MAQRMIGYAQARRAPAAEDFAALIAEVDDARRARARRRPALSLLSRAVLAAPARRDAGDAGPPADWIVEWKFDGIRAQLIRRGGGMVAVVARRGADLRRLSRPRAPARATCLRTSRSTASSSSWCRRRARRAPTRSTASQPFASLQQRLGRKVVSDKMLQELPVAFIAYDLLEHATAATSAPSRKRERRAKLEAPCRRGVRARRKGERAAAAAAQPARRRRRLGRARRRSARRRARLAAKG